MTSYIPKRIQKRDYLTLKHEVHSLSHKKTKLKGALSGLRQFLAIASQLKMMRNAFYFTLKALFVLEIFQILFWVFGYVGIQHDERAKVNFKISYVSNWIKTITIHMLPDISRSQGNLTTKFVPLIEYDIRNFLVEKSCTKCGGQSFFKDENWTYFWINSLKFYTVCFVVCPSRGLPKHTETELLITCFLFI